jgi:S-DNA-T family DNA segregation ATPase FtsK/SpoIIIE
MANNKPKRGRPKKTNSKSKEAEKKVNKSPKKTEYYELKLIGLLAFTVLSVISLHTSKVGIIGDYLKNVYLGTFSTTGFLIPYIVLMVGFLMLNNNLAKYRFKYILVASLGFFAVFLIFVIINNSFLPNNPFTPSNIVDSYVKGTEGIGLGTVGNMVGFIILKLIDVPGTYILLFVTVVAIVLLTTNFSFIEFFKSSFNKSKTSLKEKNEKRKIEKEKQKVVKENLKILDKIERTPVKKKNDIKMFDYESYSEEDKKEEVIAQPVEETSKIIEIQPNVKVDTETGEVIEDIIIDMPEPLASTNNEEIENNSEEIADQVEIVEDEIVSEDIVETNETISKEELESIDIVTYDINAQPEEVEIPEPEEIVEEPKEEKPSQGPKNPVSSYVIPSLDMLAEGTFKGNSDKEKIRKKALVLENTLDNFGVDAKVNQVTVGPTITRFEIQPAPGVKVSKIVSLNDDIALNLEARNIRIVAPIPGKAAVGIEIPNDEISIVTLRDVLEISKGDYGKNKLSFGLGKDIAGTPIISKLDKMPHLLIAGATGSGKSVCVNTIIASILCNAKPNEVKFLMIDPKVVELNNYNGIPHLILPVVTDPKKAAGALGWAVSEMQDRYKLFADSSVRDINGYNKKFAKEEDKVLPRVVVIIDELADLMMVAPNQIEDSICRLAQMARAAGIHLIVATQRPSVDVITGIIKANIPSRIAFSVSSQTDSRTIIDIGGAEKLLGKGDMLYYPVGESKPFRVQGAFISDEEVESIVEYIKAQNIETSVNDTEIVKKIETIETSGEEDEHLQSAIEFVVLSSTASISMLQRKFRIGYNRAARLIDSMEERGIVGPPQGSKPRDVLVSPEELD